MGRRRAGWRARVRTAVGGDRRTGDPFLHDRDGAFRGLLDQHLDERLDPRTGHDVGSDGCEPPHPGVRGERDAKRRKRKGRRARLLAPARGEHQSGE